MEKLKPRLDESDLIKSFMLELKALVHANGSELIRSIAKIWCKGNEKNETEVVTL